MEGRFGLLGAKLGHSFSREIHQALGGYEYEMIELEPEEIGPLLRSGEFRGLNVTIPYKQTVIPFLDRLSPRAEMVGAVNTIVRDEKGLLTGYNTDWDGLEGLLARAGLSPLGRKCLVLGSGGAGRMAAACLQAGGAREVRIISRRGEDNYLNLDRHRDAALLINATPVGMFPSDGESPVDLHRLPGLEGVVDLIYNPLRTVLLQQAEKLGLKGVNGLYMLVEQARKACELFLERPVARERSEEILADLTRQLSISREEMETRAKSQASWREKRKEERNENPGC
ncbi:MAG: shikimate dehydrogenase [Clostridia bacterium]|nr:shikimate dehydrogenase [Clostridia bacterium]